MAKEKTEAATEKAEVAVEESTDEKKPEASAEVAKLVDKVMKLSADDRKAFTASYIGKLPVLELAEQVKTLEEVFGVTAAAPMAVAAVPAGAGAEAAEEEKSAFDVVLKEIGDKKIQVIKGVREITQLDLKAAKALVDAAPKAVKEGVSKEEAENIKKKLEDQGAVIEIK